MQSRCPSRCHWRRLGQAIHMLVLHCEEGAPVAPMAAVARALGGLAEAAELHPGFAAGGGAAVLGAQQHRAAQGVEAEHRVGDGHEADGADGVGGDQIPVHHVAEGLIEPYPVLEHRQALRRAQQGRGGKAVEMQRGLQRVALLVGQGHAGQVLRQQLGKVGGGLLFERIAVDLVGVLGRRAKALGAAGAEGHGGELLHGGGAGRRSRFRSRCRSGRRGSRRELRARRKRPRCGSAQQQCEQQRPGHRNSLVSCTPAMRLRPGAAS